MNTRLRLALVACAALLLPAVVVPAAHAALPWVPCSEPQGFECARLDVPLDRSGVVPGPVSLAVSRVAATSNPTLSAVVALAGGPGQAALPLSTDFAQELGAGLGTRDLLIFDQRGTGRSGALDCPALHRSGSMRALIRRCALELGPARGSYRTADSVQDLEAIRVAAGYERLVLFGVSYGTKLAMDYAAAHPDRVEALILDSVVLPEGPDAFFRNSMTSAPRVESDVCAQGACAGATADPTGDLARIAARLDRGVLRGSVVSDAGRRYRTSMSQATLLDTILAGDLNPTLRAEMPGAIRAALTGDATPLLRLAVRGAGLSIGDQSAPDDDPVLFLATTCEEVLFPWNRAAGYQQRLREAAAAAAALPPGALGPFSQRVALQTDLIRACAPWPNASPPPAPPGPLPVVRTLVLDGRLDDRTPLEDALQVPARIPGAEVVDIPYVGHSTLTSDLSECADQAVARFFAGEPASPCAPAPNPFPPTARPPSSLSRVAPAALKGVRGRTLAAVRATINDARRQIIGEAIARGTVPRRVGGLRAGTASVTGGTFRLSRYEYVPGVAVSGRVPGAGAATVTVTGRAGAHGKLRITPNGAVTGTLGGRRVSTTIASARRSDALPSLAEVLALPDWR